MTGFNPASHSVRTIVSRINALEQNHITLSELFIRLEYQICTLHNLPKNTSLEDEIEKLKEDIGNQVEGLEEAATNVASGTNVNRGTSEFRQDTERPPKIKTEAHTESYLGTHIERGSGDDYHHSSSKKKSRSLDSTTHENESKSHYDRIKIKKTSKRSYDDSNDSKKSDVSKERKISHSSSSHLAFKFGEKDTTSSKVKSHNVLDVANFSQEISSDEKKNAHLDLNNPTIKPTIDTKSQSRTKNTTMPDEEFPIMKASPKEFCICRTPKTQNMISCDFCEESYHNRCLKLSTDDVKQLKKNNDWQCPKCKMNANTSIDKSKVSKDFFAIFAKMCSKGQFPPNVKIAV